MTKYRTVTQEQLELWLIDPTTRAYLFSLWASRETHKKAQGEGEIVDHNSAEKTFSAIMKNEGVKEGYKSAMNVIGELEWHGMLDEGVAVDMPKMDESILDVITEKGGDH